MPIALLLAAQLTYFVPPSNDALRAPTPMALQLVDAPFEDVRLGIQFAGTRQRFARLRYGEVDSIRVTAVADIGESGEASLYLDLNRDLAITRDERVAPTDENARAWEVSLPAIVRDPEGQTTTAPRRLRFELNGSGSILSAVTLGWLEGEAPVGERTLRVRRRDLNVNGFFGDRGDQLWIDRDGNGEWAPFGELYASLPFLTLPEAEGRVRYAVRSDREGHRLVLAEADEVGTIQIALHGETGEIRPDIRSLEALLIGRDGTVVSIHQHARPIEVPIGDYRLSLLSIAVAASGEGEPDWTFVFSEAFLPTEASWRGIGPGSQLSMDPLRTSLSLELSLPDKLLAVTSGDKIRAQPYLFIGADRLLIRNAYRGERGWGNRAKLEAAVALIADGDAPLATYSSGFL